MQVSEQVIDFRWTMGLRTAHYICGYPHGERRVTLPDETTKRNAWLIRERRNQSRSILDGKPEGMWLVCRCLGEEPTPAMGAMG